MSNLGNKAIMAKNIQYYMELHNKTRNEMCDALGVKYTTFTDWVKGNSYPRIDKIELMANYFKISKSDLVEEHTEPPADIKTFDNLYPIEVHKYPMLGEIACGEPIFVNEERESYVLSGTKIDADFCLKAKGDSMIGARILDGDIVFIKETTMVENGDIAAVAINDEVLLKRFDYLKEENILALHSENPRYKTMRFSGEELDHIRVLGKAVAFQSDII